MPLASRPTPSQSTFRRALLALVLAACGAQPTAQQQPAPQASPPAAEPAATSAGAPGDAEAQSHLAAALELEAAGRYDEAWLEVQKAGDSRDAGLLAAKLAILRDDLLSAEQRLGALVARDAADPDAQYNLGLVAQKRNDFNAARRAYLAAVKADPRYAPARYNLALLTWDAGVREEARHHGRKFLELWPDDPRAPDLRAKLGLDAAGAAAP